jgi:hypothetical protein
MTEKTFRGDFENLLKKLIDKESFAFTRFSDGELRILQNKKLSIGYSYAFVNGQWHQGQWGKEEHKLFDPEKDSVVREYLEAAFKHKQHNYFKGICCKCCVGDADWQWQFDSYLDKNEENLTWANLLINANYPAFIEKMIPKMQQYPVVYVCNTAANLKKFPLKNLVKDFRVGSNCHLNNIGTLDEMRSWMRETNPKGHLFLFSAASLSNLLIHKLYSEFPENTYMDIGSTLNPMLDMTGWVGSRGYLRSYWMKQPDPYGDKVCTW